MGIQLFILLIAGTVLAAAPMARPVAKKAQAVNSSRRPVARRSATVGKAATAKRSKTRVVRRRVRVSPSRMLQARYVEPPLSSFPEMAPPLPDLSPAELHDSFFAARVGRRVHQAIDIMRPEGTPLYACVDGFVEKLATSNLGGISIYLTNNERSHLFFYAHLSAYAEGVMPGMPVVRGQLIGYVGRTGNARYTAAHLHLQILQASRGAVNPYPVLRNVVDGGLQSKSAPVVEGLNPTLDSSSPVVEETSTGTTTSSTASTPSAPAWVAPAARKR